MPEGINYAVSDEVIITVGELALDANLPLNGSKTIAVDEPAIPTPPGEVTFGTTSTVFGGQVVTWGL